MDVDNTDFRRSVVSLVDAMRNLLNNIRPEQQRRNYDDADESADDDLTWVKWHVVQFVIKSF